MDETLLPLDSDGSLPLSTVAVQFPYVNGLKYMSRGYFRQLRMNMNKTAFLPPLDGWTDKLFLVIPKVEAPPTSELIEIKKGLY
ncbi:unnamed protein product [Meloidogyne enterolobii]|uniref:Uncharacterized protein n=1 Tax=Meloidogyne enterolobii TaxID=390850 RepID=A0ACB0YE57_MELEN